MIYFDNIFVYNIFFQEHLVYLQQILEVLWIHRLYLNKEKCYFICFLIPFLGYIIIDHSVHVDPNKINTIKESPSQLLKCIASIDWWIFINNLCKDLAWLWGQSLIVWKEIVSMELPLAIKFWTYQATNNINTNASHFQLQ